MPRGTEGKLRRRNERKEARNEGNRLLEEIHGDENEEENVVMEDDNDGAEKKNEQTSPTETKKSSSKGKVRAAAPSPKKKIKTTPLILLIILTGTTLLPALLFMGDWMGKFVQKNHIMGSLGYKLGIGPSPKKRVLSFYEKHDPTKLPDVPQILSKHYGDYPRLIKRLERKYGDYGYFINWEQDEAPMQLAKEKLELTYDYLQKKFQIYAPRFVKNGARNMKYNLTTLYKKAKRIWKKTVWPHLEPFFGVPEGGATQKRNDAKEFRARKRGKRNMEFRDEDEY